MSRKPFRPLTVCFLLIIVLLAVCGDGEKEMASTNQTGVIARGNGEFKQGDAGTITLFLCGDVMTGRGIDQVMVHGVDPVIYESYMGSAYGYVRLAEEVNGAIASPVDYSYIWGDGLAVLARLKPDLRIINLETSVTTNPDYWPFKGINYRMHPENIACLSAAGIDCCVLANNHVLDWGYGGLVETLEVLTRAGIRSVGAGRDRREAKTPALFDIKAGSRLLVFAYGFGTSGVPDDWAATAKQPGVNLLPDYSNETVARIKKEIAAIHQPGDVVLLSLHWGGNWGYEVSASERRFARKLIEDAGVDVLYGHSSHHPKGIEVYQGKLILYGCGDFINDYEGISGYEQYRGDLSLMYFPTIESSSGRLLELRLVPMQIKRFQTIHASKNDRSWLMQMLNREGKRFNTQVIPAADGSFLLQWE